MKKFSKSVIVIIIIVIIGIWFASGIYTLKSDGGMQAVVIRFGQFVRIETEAGLKWHLPSPIEKVEFIKSEALRSLEVGFKTSTAGGPYQTSQFQDIPAESLMITGDENLVHTEMVVQYKIPDAKKYLFEVDDQEQTLMIAAESVIRRVVANHTLDDVLTSGKELIQAEVKSDLQSICDDYELGIALTGVNLQAVYVPDEVSEAYNDVLKAREDMNKYINEANKAKNEIVPVAQGTAAEMINQANAYKEKRIAEARGDVEAFNQVLTKYRLGEDVTRTRMYLETMQEVLPGAKIYFVGKDGNTLQFLPLGDNTEVVKNSEGGQ